jgi:hypothetical protein
MMGPLGASLRNPASAALFAAIVTLVARYIDHRISRKPDYLMDYLKAMIFNGALVFFVVNSIVGGRGGVAAGMGQSIMNGAF